MEKRLVIDSKEVIPYIYEKLIEGEEKSDIKNAEYHHNSPYEFIPSVFKYGILSINRLQEYGITDYSKEELKIWDDDTSHVNGIDGVSLSKVGLTDLYRDEMEYDPYKLNEIDYIVSNDIKAGRNSTNYGNEFITKDRVLLSDIKSLDIRLINYIEKELEKPIDQDLFYKDLIEKYNYLLEAARIIKYKKLDIGIREMSNKQLSLNINTLSSLPNLIKK